MTSRPVIVWRDEVRAVVLLKVENLMTLGGQSDVVCLGEKKGEALRFGKLKASCLSA